MKLSCSTLLLSVGALSVLARPAPQAETTGVDATTTGSTVVVSSTASAASSVASSTVASSSAVATETATPEAGEGEGEGEGEEGEGEENEIEQQAQFGTVVTLGGGDIKTDTLFPPSVSPTTTYYSTHPQTPFFTI